MYLDGENIETIMETCSLAIGISSGRIQEFITNEDEGLLKKYIGGTGSFLDSMIEQIDANHPYELVKDRKWYTLNFNKIAVFHITSRFNKESCWNGLIPLRDVLSSKNEVSDYLADHEISIKVRDNTVELYSGQNKYNVDNTKPLYSRIIHDTGVCGFLVNNNIRKNIHTETISSHPEFFHTITAITKNNDIKNDWKGKAQSYIIKFVVNLQDIDFGNSSDNNYEMNYRKKLLMEKYLNFIAASYLGKTDYSNNCIITLKEQKYVLPEDIIAVLD